MKKVLWISTQFLIMLTPPFEIMEVLDKYIINLDLLSNWYVVLWDKIFKLLVKIFGICNHVVLSLSVFVELNFVARRSFNLNKH